MRATNKVKRSIERAGPLLVALVLGALLVVTSALAHRDARQAAFVVAERQGVGLLHRAEAVLIHRGGGRPAPKPTADLVATVLEANHAIGLTYVATVNRESRQIDVAAGHPTLGPTLPGVGKPIFGDRRVRMISGHGPRPDGLPALGNPPPRAEPSPLPPGPTPLGPPPAFPAGPPPDSASARFGPGFEPREPPPEHPLVLIEFEPIGSMDAIRRALVALILSSSVAALLTAAAAVLWWRARRSDEVERRMAAQEHLASLGEMSAVLAHEIRNPLAALKGHAQLLGERMEGSPEAPRVQRVVDEAVRLEKLTSSLLEFARSGRIDATSADPVTLVVDAVAATEPARVEVQTHGAPVATALDAARMRQVLVNLLDNALAVTPPDGRVVVTVESGPDGDGVTYTVRDRGPGVPAADRTRLFQPFFTTKTRGVGLGLSVARRIVALHRGTLTVSDAPGGGAIFRVDLPGQPVTGAAVVPVPRRGVP